MKKILVSIALLSILGSYAHAFDPTSRPITVVIPFAPGGGVDSTFKNLQKYADQKGIKLIPVFKPGADTIIGTKELADRQPDGFNIGISTAAGLSTYSLSESDTGNITVVTGVQTTSQVIVTHTKSKIKNFNQLKKELQETPGLTIAVGNPGQRIMWDQILELADIKTQPTFVPYKGAGQIIPNVIGSHVELTYLPTSVLKSHVDSGHLVALAVTYPVNTWPDVLVLSKSFGSWKDYEFGHVLYLPKGASPEITRFWANFIKEYLDSPDIKEEFKNNYVFALPQGQRVAEERIKSLKPKLLNILNSEKKN